MTNCSHNVPFENHCEDCVTEGLSHVFPSKAPPLERRIRAALGRFNDPSRDVAGLVAEVVAKAGESE